MTMCDKCSAKLIELDNKVPHLIDVIHGVRGYSLQQPGMIEALDEYRRFTERLHR